MFIAMFSFHHAHSPVFPFYLLHSKSCLTFTFEDGARIMASIRAMPFWSPADNDDLLRLVAANVVNASSSIQPQTGRQVLQDYTNFPKFLTQNVWDLLVDPSLSFDQKLL